MMIQMNDREETTVVILHREQWRSQKNLSTGAHDAVADPGIFKRGALQGRIQD